VFELLFSETNIEIYQSEIFSLGEYEFLSSKKLKIEEKSSKISTCVQ